MENNNREKKNKKDKKKSKDMKRSNTSKPSPKGSNSGSSSSSSGRPKRSRSISYDSKQHVRISSSSSDSSEKKYSDPLETCQLVKAVELAQMSRDEIRTDALFVHLINQMDLRTKLAAIKIILQLFPELKVFKDEYLRKLSPRFQKVVNNNV